MISLIKDGSDPTEVPSADELALRLETAEAERERALLEQSEPDLVLAIDYANGALTPEAMADFERRLAEEPELQAIVFPLLELRQTMRAAHNEAVEQGMPAARLAIQRMIEQVALEESGALPRPHDEPLGSGTPGEQDTLHTPRVSPRASRLASWTLRILGTLAILVVAIWILSFFGPWSPLVPAWRAQHDELSQQAQLTLGENVTVHVMGPYFVAESAPGWFDPRKAFNRVSEIYVDAHSAMISSGSYSRREVRIITPRLLIQSNGGIFHVVVENGCEVKVTAQVGALVVTPRATLAVPAAADARTGTAVGAGLAVRLGCDGTLGDPGAAPSTRRVQP